MVPSFELRPRRHGQARFPFGGGLLCLNLLACPACFFSIADLRQGAEQGGGGAGSGAAGQGGGSGAGGQGAAGGGCAVRVAAGINHSCAIRFDGTVWCWGNNALGQLGIGSEDSDMHSMPLQVENLPLDAVALALGGSQSCAIVADGGLWCWGIMNAGPAEPLPVKAASIGAVAQVAAGLLANMCAIRQADGAVRCWGYNGKGQLGDGSSTNAFIDAPATVNLLSNTQLPITSVVTGGSHACAIDASSNLWCWGNNNKGQLGDGSSGNGKVSLSPMQPEGLPSSVATVAAGDRHTCAGLATGDLWCWGGNGSGQLGNGSEGGTVTSPASSWQFPAAIGQVAARADATCARLVNGTLWCWGAGPTGSGASSAPIPQRVESLSSSVSDVAVGSTHACAVQADGALWCWGSNFWGKLGADPADVGDYVELPLRVPLPCP